MMNGVISCEFQQATSVSVYLRVPSKGGPVDVLVRCQPEPREYLILRFTAFSAGPGPQVHQLSGDFRSDGESRPVLGEAALLDARHSW